jgi:hypothetical protein
MSKYTPGPWELEIDGTMTAHGFTVIGPDGEDIAQVSAYLWTKPYGADGPQDTSEAALATANAHLIAAAPDLLEACQVALAILWYASPPNPKTEALLKAAIAKAEAES